MNCRVLPHEIGDGPANMALDESLLDSADANPTSAIFRTYAWSEPTLSLGYFQTAEELAQDARWNTVSLVRRITGGGALWHHHELTYALIVPRAHPLAERPANLYREVHAAIKDLLIAQGFPATRRGETETEKRAARPFLCFLDRDSEDLLLADRKVVGSAQRRRPAAVLQHGSLLLGVSSTTPELPGLRELSKQVCDVEFWSKALGEGLPAALGFATHEDAVSPLERSHASVLARTRYRDSEWTLHRRRASRQEVS